MICLQLGLGVLQGSFYLSQPSSLLVQLLFLPFQLELQQIQAALLAHHPCSCLILPLANILQTSVIQTELFLQDGQEEEACCCFHLGQQLVGLNLSNVTAQGVKLLLERGSVTSELGFYYIL